MGNFTQIQPAINASAHGDTIIVHNGTYLENISYDGKNVFLTSLYHYTNDRNDIYNTIIDGRNLDFVVSFWDFETRAAVLNGFTVTGGTGGIIIVFSSPTISNCLIVENHGIDVGGIHAVGAAPFFVAMPLLSGNVIRNNSAIIRAGGIYFSVQNDDMFDPINKNSIFFNNGSPSADIEMHLGALNYVVYHVILDTFTVSHDEIGFVSADCDYTFSAVHHKLELIDADIYVSPLGCDDTNDGLSPLSPFKSIARGMNLMVSNPTSPNILHLAPGTYRKSEGQHFPINIKSHTSLLGSGADEVIFDGEDVQRFIFSSLLPSNFKISGITFQNIVPREGDYPSASPINIFGANDMEISHCIFLNTYRGIILNGWPDSDALLNDLLFDGCSHTILDLFLDSATLENITIRNQHPISIPPNSHNQIFHFRSMMWFRNQNQSYRGHYTISNLLVHDIDLDISRMSSQSILIATDGFSDVLINNATITGIRRPWAHHYLETIHNTLFTARQRDDFKIYNSIIYESIPFQIYRDQHSTISFHNSLLNIINNANPPLPLIDCVTHESFTFIDPENGNFQLNSSSLCVDAGTTDIPNFIFPSYDLAGNPRIWGASVDIGAFELFYPLATFDAVPATGEAPLTVHFTDTSGGGDGIHRWQWDFMNNSLHTSEEQHPTFIYTTPGVYTVRLTINSGESLITKEDFITVTPRAANFIASPLTGAVPLTVQFVDQSLGVVESWAWDFNNDGNIDSVARNPLYTYTQPGTYTVRLVINAGMSELVREDYITISVSDIDDTITPLETRLLDAYPNPFNPKTTILFSIGESSDRVNISVYNIKGQLVKTLVNGTYGRGSYDVEWDGEDNYRNKVSSGIYFLRMETSIGVETKKMLLLK
jgi:PKD repeat protein